MSAGYRLGRTAENELAEILLYVADPVGRSTASTGSTEVFVRLL